MLQCLANQHSIERIAMMKWQVKKVGQGWFVKRKARDIVLLAPGPQIFVCGPGKRQLAELVFCERFPYRYHAQEDFVRFVLDCIGRRVAKPWIVGDVPEKDMRIEK